MQIQIDEAERLGLGTKKYELVKVERTYLNELKG